MAGTYKGKFLDGTSAFPGIREDASQERVALFAPVTFYDDFIGSDVAIPAAASPESGCRWVKKIVGTTTLVGGADALNGTMVCTLDATSEKQEASAYFNDELTWSALQNCVIEFKFTPTVLPTGNGELYLGVSSAWADGPRDGATYSAFIVLDGSGAIVCESDDNATDATTAAGVTLINTSSCIVRIDCTAAATLGVKFYVNGSLVKTSAAWAASAANSHVQPMFGAYKVSGTGLGTLTVDYVRIWQERA